MSLTGIISVSGLPGLHKILSQTKNGLIVESLDDGRRRPVYSSQKVSSLEDISIYTLDDDVPLKDVFMKIHEKQKGKEAPSHKSDPEELRAFLTEVLEDVDHERVYNSDVAKLFQWYNILIEKDLLKEDEEEESKEGEKKEAKKKAPAKKPAASASKAAAKKATPKKTSASKGTATKKGSAKSASSKKS